MAKGPRPITVEFFEDAAGEHRWRVRASNGELMATSGEGFKGGASKAERAWLTFLRNVKESPVMMEWPSRKETT